MTHVDRLQSRRARLSTRKKCAFGVLTVAALLVTLEIAARVVEHWLPPLAVDPGLGFLPQHGIFMPAADDPRDRVTRPEKTQAFVTQRFRAQRPDDALRIVVVGESSVHFLQDELQGLAQTLSAEPRMQSRRVEILNAGGKSYGSQRLLLVLREMLDYQPDLVLLYLGHNEFEEVEQLDLAGLRTADVERQLSRFALVRVARDRLAAARIAQLREEHNRRLLDQDRPNVARAWRHAFTAADVEERMSAFRKNVEQMLQECQRRQVPVILGTIPSNLARPYLPEAQAERYTNEVFPLFRRGEFSPGLARARSILRETPGRHQSSDQENTILRELAAKYAIPLADVEQAVIAAEPHGVPGETLFADHCHLNAAGNRLWITTYQPAIIAALAPVAARPDEGHQPQGTKGAAPVGP